MTKKHLPITANRRIRRDHSARGDFFIPTASKLCLSDGTVFEGKAPDWQHGSYIGEVVFNTGMTGYIESLTDPSYSGQILVFTYPLIGNYGVLPSVGESDRIQVNGVVMSELATNWSHSASDRSLLEWLRSQDIPLLTNVDTRAITKHLRTKGTMMGAISSDAVKLKGVKAHTKFVSIDEPIDYKGKGKKKVVLVDCGAKENILRSLLAMGLSVKRVPYDYDYTAETFDGVFLSNGPGDPTDYAKTVEIARKALKLNKPIFGICLGHQILGLAAGAKTYKLLFGHRGHNQPCMEKDGTCVITSQNHSYAIVEKSLPKGWNVLFRNLNDNSVEGIEHKTQPFFSVQFHPEACPGPTDTADLFKKFYETL